MVYLTGISSSEEEDSGWPLLKKDKIQIKATEYCIGQKIIRIQRNPGEYLSNEQINQLQEKDPILSILIFFFLGVKKLGSKFSNR